MTYHSYDSARNAILNVVDDGYSDTPIAAPNRRYSPDGSAFVRLHFPTGGETEPLERGNDATWIRNDNLTIQIFTPLGGGSKAGLVIAEKLDGLFRGQNLTYGLCIDSVTKIAEKIDAPGKYYQINLRVRFYYPVN